MNIVIVCGMEDGTFGGSFYIIKKEHPSWTESFLREWPRRRYEIRYSVTSLVPDLYLNKRGMLAWRKRELVHQSGLLPHSYDFITSHYDKRSLCDCIVLPNGQDNAGSHRGQGQL